MQRLRKMAAQGVWIALVIGMGVCVLVLTLLLGRALHGLLWNQAAIWSRIDAVAVLALTMKPSGSYSMMENLAEREQRICNVRPQCRTLS
jgi:hypothetical protein